MAKRKFRALLVGCGSISRAWLGAEPVQKDCDVVAFVDIDPAAAQAKAAEFGDEGVLVETDLAAALKATGPDVVFNCTIPSAHCETTLAALRAGCHVLSEKPLAETLPEARRMVAAAEKAGRTFAVMQNRRWLNGMRRLRAFLESGAIGRVTTVHSDFYIGAHFGGFRDHMEHVLLVDMAIHTFDQARMITAADPLSVYCHEWNPPGSWYDHDASAVAIFEMTDDIVYTYNGSWCSEGLNTPWECHWRIVGTGGTVLWRGGEEFEAEVLKGAGGFKSETTARKVPKGRALKHQAHAGCLRNFLDCLRTGETPETVARDNIKSFAMCVKAVESATRGRKVRV